MAGLVVDGISLSWPPVTISVGSPSGWLLEQTAQWYGDHFKIVKLDQDRHDVCCIVDPMLVDDLLESIAGGLPTMTECVTGQRYVLTELWVGQGESRERAVLLKAGGSRVLAVRRESQGAVTLLARQIRAVASAALYEHGWVPFHASGVVDSGGRALVMIGPSKSGKTSALLSLLRGKAGALLCNDRVFLRREDVTLARGLPVSVGIRSDTAQRFLPYFQSDVHVDNASSGDRGARVGSPRLHVPPRELARVFGVGVARQGVVRAIVRVRFDPVCSGYRVRRIHHADAESSLTESRLDLSPEWAAEWLSSAGSCRPRARMTSTAGPDVPTYELVTGQQTTDWATALGRGLSRSGEIGGE